MDFDIGFLKKSFGELKQHIDEVGTLFLSTIEKDAPNLSEPFRDSKPTDLFTGFFQSIQEIIDEIEQKQSTTGIYTGEITRFKTKHRLNDQLFKDFCKRLALGFSEFFDPEWADDLQMQWENFFSWLGKNLSPPKARSVSLPREEPRAPVPIHTPQKHESRSSTDAPSGGLKTVANSLAGSVLRKALEEEVNDEFRKLARDKAREILKQALEEEAEELLKKGAA